LRLDNGVLFDFESRVTPVERTFRGEHKETAAYDASDITGQSRQAKPTVGIGLHLHLNLAGMAIRCIRD
jgi:hypothetical protein